MRPRIPAAVVAAALAFTLSACGSDAPQQSTPSSTGASQAASATPTEAPDVTESAEGMPTVGKGADGNPILEFPDGDAPSGLQISVLEEGDGEEITANSLLSVNYVGQVWGNKDPFDSSFGAGQSALFPLNSLVTGWAYTLDGHHVGGKYIISLPSDYGYGPSGGNDAAGIGADDTISFYVEVHDGWSAASTGQADATIETENDDLPVTLEGDVGSPVTSIAVKDGQSEPTELGVKVIARGSGDEVGGEGSNVIINYAATSWDGDLTEDSWTGEPEGLSGAQQVTLGSGTVFDSLEGVPVGSRVLLMIPESDGGDQTSSPALVAVVDILGYQKAAS